MEVPAFTDGELTGISVATVDLTADVPTLHTIVPATKFANNVDWSPDGSHIVFSAPIEGGEPGGALSDLWTVRPDGSELTQVTDVAAAGGAAVQPTFTPDGQRIIFMLTEASERRLTGHGHGRPGRHRSAAGDQLRADVGLAPASAARGVVGSSHGPSGRGELPATPRWCCEVRLKAPSDSLACIRHQA